VTVPDAALAMIVAALPGAVLWDDGSVFGPDDLLVFDGRVPAEPPKRYVAYWPDHGTRDALAVCGVSDDVMYRFQTTSVAPDRQQAEWLAERICDGVVDLKPAVTGWECGPIGHTYAQQPQHDETVMEHPVVYMADLFEVRAQRLPEDDSSSSS
jgi:hypothetical protein